MHPVILKDADDSSCSGHPPRRYVHHGIGQHIWNVDDEEVRDCGSRSAKPVHVGWRMVPLVDPPEELGMGEPVHPIVAEVGQDEVKQDSHAKGQVSDGRRRGMIAGHNIIQINADG